MGEQDYNPFVHIDSDEYKQLGRYGIIDRVIVLRDGSYAVKTLFSGWHYTHNAELAMLFIVADMAELKRRKACHARRMSEREQE